MIADMIWVLACSALTVASCVEPPSPPVPAAPAPPREIAHQKPEPVRRTQPKTDQELIDAVRRAAEARVTPEGAEAEVGPAAVSTRRNLPLEALRGVDLIPDEASGQRALSLEGARDVVYWARPLESRNPRMVGIIWRNDGSVEVFFGVVLPP